MSTSAHGAGPGMSARVRRRAAVAALATACLILAVAQLGSSAGAATASKTTVVLGSTATTPDPSCPSLPCQAVGSVTGFQVSNDQTQLPFRVSRAGKIKSWTLTLAQPTNSQRRVAGTSPPRYNLRSQGAIHVLSPYLGQTVKFGANLKVEKGEIVAITVPTWAPAFAQSLGAKNVWRASREPGKCTNSTDVRQGEPHQKKGTRATYGCKYSTARLLYTATLVEEK